MRVVLFVVLAAAAASALLRPASAQMGGGGDQKDPFQLKIEREEAERKENERTYNEQMKRMKSQGGKPSTSADPWKGVRSSTDTTAKR